MTLTIMALWVVGIALLIGVAVKRGRATAKKPHQFSPLNTAEASAVITRAIAASALTQNESKAHAHKGFKGIWARVDVTGERSSSGQPVSRSIATGALSQTKPGKPSGPAKGKKVL
ncbi:MULTISPECIES: hypothetical protein [unclassified Pseudomonas]|uniref:hypothetical protein n=1 Tax=unclassified Pseudomonas TaxID=196821 RepID=UPI0015A0446B|nr:MULTISPECIES: hypothetical protein [unclassified Pseudomonas]NWC96092.1 hypothetical protein [Pseudomonas sp. IPO3779]NWD20987.1 hypothetical protein [Pseudomonas sp. IPO3778]